MDTDAQTLETALGVLRQQFGNRLAGSIGDTQVQMRHVLEQQMGVDEVAGDRLVKQLTHLGRLVYHGGTDGDDRDAEGTGPVISMPGVTTGQSGEAFAVPTPNLTSAAGPDMPSPSLGGVTAPVAINSGMSAVTPTTGMGMVGLVPLGGGVESTAATEDVAPVGTAISPGEANRATMENREGATMGQLADTNVSAPSSPTEQVIAQGADDSEGYWQIG